MEEIKLRKCKNNCIFCFINQLPKGLRKTLYVKDDDYIESYTNGNFITLTNLEIKDIQKIIKFKIEPLYISIHSFDKKIREILFNFKNSENNEKSLKFFKILDDNRIRTNIQIVLCPGINDGIDLKNTLDILIKNYKNILSIGIVPVGITKFNKSNLLVPYDKVRSLELIKFIENFKKENKKNKNIKKIFLSDEFYILAGKSFPLYSSYGKFLQIQNGIGKVANFLNEVESELKKINISKELEKINKIDLTVGKCKNFKKYLIITSEYGFHPIKLAIDKVIKLFNQFNISFLNNINFEKNIEILPVKNNFFGGNVKVTALLTAVDIVNTLKKTKLNLYDKIFIPSCILNYDTLTLDGYKKDFFIKLSSNIKIIPEDGHSFVNNVILSFFNIIYDF